MTCGIYTITSQVGRVYVGQSVDIERRLSEYRLKTHKGFKFAYEVAA